jgi:hypothetical protein
MTEKLVIASNNKGKIAELTELLSPLLKTPSSRPAMPLGKPAFRPWQTTAAWRWMPWEAVPGSVPPALPARMRPIRTT